MITSSSQIKGAEKTRHKVQRGGAYGDKTLRVVWIQEAITFLARVGVDPPDQG